MSDITALIEQGKKLAAEALPAATSFTPDVWLTETHEFRAHHSPATMLRLYAELEKVQKYDKLLASFEAGDGLGAGFCRVEMDTKAAEIARLREALEEIADCWITDEDASISLREVVDSARAALGAHHE